MSNVIEIKSGEIQQNNVVVLNDINVEIKPKEFVYLIGKTGSGKSSLLKVLYGELMLSNGTGSIDSFDLNALRKKDIPKLRRVLGIVFQDFQLLTDRTVLANLLFVMGASGWKDKKKMQKRAKEVLQLVGIEQKINSMPFALSGGEQQRVAIARALLNSPKLILADEPTGNLDPETSEEIMRLLLAISKEENTSILMATHDMSMVEKYPGRILRVENQTINEVNTINQFDPFTPFTTD
ncbi:MAG: ATP-binding cassette domain-containing protein [Crocinitomicaceae bacterium]|uniref:Cell division ATP-binding protein FtsE n=1 Tax=uncultured Flavobacteriia bacterium TaxID=212695 RepID=H6RDP4_9BACT|nr:cell division transporter, ATP-binding protein FtsE [uncultured bacterium]MDB4075011.1 ATP-binding cassette domain-containing protein [Crocinitomicaceae bacterium]MDC0099609.1 ATP-binding cassette domain-containing protein [Crocinitomicaceae bacterium]MDC1384504.1 ATP-binding cassette domain-containing protein [Crocinitomicaceae bacterium]CCF99155.1 ABC-type transporter ATP-binding protein [uncultured Flavobacteriia bacterium]